MKYYSSFILLVLILLPAYTFAQDNIVVSGQVTFLADGTGIPFATVAVLDQNNRVINGVATDLDGKYSIRAASNGKLQFSFVGHTTQIVDVNGRRTIDILLEESVQAIEEVQITAIGRKGPVNTGYGTVEQRDVTGSVASVDMRKLSKAPITDVGQMLQGQIPGVQIITNSGDPGSGVTVRIRGNTSLSGGNEPLYIVDGVPYLDHGSEAGQSISNRKRSPIADINPKDIEKIDVLKDASATAIYGSRAANGVVIITTKRGRKGKTRVNFTSSTGLRMPPKHIPLNGGNSYKILQLEAYQHAGEDGHEALEYLRDNPNALWYEEYNNNTDWIKALERKTVVQDYNLNIRGGGEYTAYSFSLSYLNEPGSMINTGYDRLSGRFNLDYRISDKLRFGNSIFYARGRLENPSVGGDNNPYEMAFTKAPNLSIYEQDSLGNDLNTYFNPQNTYVQDYGTYNPVAFANSSNSNTTSNTLTTSVFAIYNPFTPFTITSRVNMNFGDNDDFGFIPAEATGLVWGNEMVNRNVFANSSHTDFSQENIFAYNNTFKEIHELSATFVTSVEISKEDEFSNEASNTGSSYLQRINASNRWLELGSSRGDNALASLTGELRYNLLDRYLVTGTLRRDGSSKFGEDSRYGIFPAFSAAWRLSSEPFMQNLNFITDFKLRASYGANGGQPDGNYLYLGTYSSQGKYMNYAIVAADNIQLNHLSWETSIQKNVGLDLSMWNDRVTLVNDWYIKTTYDLLYRKSIPGSTGFEEVLQNFGNVENKGFDVGADVYILQGPLNWNVSVNLSRNINFITELARGESIEGDDIRGYKVRAEVGDALGTFYGYRWQGVYANDLDAIARDEHSNIIYDFDGNPKYLRFDNMNGYTFRGGDAKYEDINHDGLINELDVVKIGDSNPKFFGGIMSNLAWKSLTFSIFFEYKYGHQVINMARRNTESLDNQNNQNTATLRRWRKQGDETDMPRAIYEQGHNSEASNRFVEDASYIRLRTASLSYSVNENFANRLRLENMEVFISSFNIHTWTNYTGADPEIGIDGDSPLAVGVDNSRTSLPRIFTLGLDLTF